MFEKLTLEELQALHGLLFEAIEANKKLIHELTRGDVRLLAYRMHLVKINASLVNLDHDVCLRITELNKG